MPAQTIFFVGDKLHVSQTAASIYSVSSTAAGYNKEAVRDTSWLGAWKPNNSAIDEYIQIDGGSAGWLGTGAGEIVHCAIAYDARGADQTTISVLHDAADNPAGAFAQLKGTFTLNATGPTVDWLSFTIPSGGKRYIRLTQGVANRGVGTVTVPIYAIAFFVAAGVYIIDTEYASDAPGPGSLTPGSNVGVGETAGGMWHTNRNGAPYQEFDVTFEQATLSLWNALMSHFMTWHEGPSRAIWLQYEGIYNAALANFGMVHQVGFDSSRSYLDQYDVRLRFRTVGKPI